MWRRAARPWAVPVRLHDQHRAAALRLPGYVSTGACISTIGVPQQVVLEQKLAR